MALLVQGYHTALTQMPSWTVERQSCVPDRLWLMEEVPETRYAKVGRDRIAYQVLGKGPLDLVYVPSLGDCIDGRWEWPSYANFLRRLASFSRLIMFDRRGMGASDPVSLEALPSWEEWADDARTVMDAVGSEHAAIFGINEATPVAMLFAATHPERTQALVLFNGFARRPGPTASEQETAELVALVEETWGTEAVAQVGSPDLAGDRAYTRWLAKMTRMACSPRVAAAYLLGETYTNVEAALSSIRVPTLLVHRRENARAPLDEGRFIAEKIAGAHLVVVPGNDVHPFVRPTSQILDEVEAFLTGVPTGQDADRALAAILFTDIVGSTETAASLGDRQWRNVLETHLGLSRTVVEKHRGRLVKVVGDGMLATFDGPGRAIRCALALHEAVRPLGVELRAGLHTGEVEVMGEDVGGIAVHIAARVVAEARSGEVLVSGAVPPLVAGSGIEFEERGEHELKGVPGTWRLFAVRE